MYLSKLFISGFKSFADPVEVKFGDGITAVVGPNGCGKSNVIDALRWVLGEQRSSNLRSDRMEDIIFSGTSVRPALNMAEVSLVILNDEKVLPVEYNEVIITRRLFRSGESEYSINMVPCRLKDISNLFFDTGMGSNAYSIIELRMVESVLSDKYDERRYLFEEAAGVQKYKIRLRECQRKLEQTNQDLERINESITGMEKNVNFLKRQVDSANKYATFKEQVKNLEINYNFTLFQEESQQLEKLNQNFSRIKDQAQDQLQKIGHEEEILKLIKESVTGKEQQYTEAQQMIMQTELQLSEINKNISIGEERINNFDHNNIRLRDDWEKTKQTFSEEQQDKDKTNLELISVLKQKESLAQEREERENDLADFNIQFNTRRLEDVDLKNKRIDSLKLLEKMKTDFHHLQTQKQSLLSEYERINGEIKNIQAKILETEKEFQDLGNHLKISRLNSEQTASDLQRLTQEIDKLQAENSDIFQKETIVEKSLSTKQAKEHLLENLHSNMDGFQQGVKRLFSEGKEKMGILGTISEFIEIPDPYFKAIESALGIYLQFVLVKDAGSAFQCVEFLGLEKGGIVTFLPLQEINQLSLPFSDPGFIDDRSLGELTGVVGWAKDIVKSQNIHQKLFHFLLGEVLVVTDRSTAFRLSKEDWMRPYVFVTLEGEVFDTAGLITGGKKGEQEMGILERVKHLNNLTREIEQEKNELQQWRNKRIEVTKKLDEKKEFLLSIKKDLEHTQDEKISQEIQFREKNLHLTNFVTMQDQLKDRLILIQTQLEEADGQTLPLESKIVENGKEYTQLEELSKKFSDQIADLEEQKNQKMELISSSRLSQVEVEAHYEKLKQTLNNIEKQDVQMKERIQFIQSELASNAESMQHLLQDTENAKLVRDQITQKKEGLIQNCELKKRDYLSVQESIRHKELDFRGLIADKEKILMEEHQLELQIKQHESHIQTLCDGIQEKYNTDLKTWSPSKEMLESFSRDRNQPKLLEQKILELKNQLARMNPGNQEALTEYEQEKTKLEFTKSQYADLVEAGKNLSKTIRKINKTARDKFLQTFEQSRKNFKQVFQTLFEGGNADLLLEENADPLEAKISIMAIPKGKGMQTLALRSSGEKSLIATALLFSLYLVKPSPYCILDEVDGPLDDANVGRYLKLIKQFSQNTQFILITHNAKTAVAANTLMGVTMEEKGVSKLVSVTLNNIKEYAVA